VILPFHAGTEADLLIRAGTLVKILYVLSIALLKVILIGPWSDSGITEPTVVTFLFMTDFAV
jgi:hypothetical protein